MSEENKTKTTLRLSAAAKELNISTKTACEELAKNGFLVENTIHQKLTQEMYDVLLKRFGDIKTNKDKTTTAKPKKEEQIITSKPIPLPFGEEDIGSDDLISAQELKQELKFSAQKKEIRLQTMEDLIESAPEKEKNPEIQELVRSETKSTETVNQIVTDKNTIVVEPAITESPTEPAKETPVVEKIDPIQLKIIGKIDLSQSKPTKPKKQPPKTDTPSLFDTTSTQEIKSEKIPEAELFTKISVIPTAEEKTIEQLIEKQEIISSDVVPPQHQEELVATKIETIENKVAQEQLDTYDSEIKEVTDSDNLDKDFSTEVLITENQVESYPDEDFDGSPEFLTIRAKDHTPKLEGLTIVGKIDLPDPKQKKIEREKTKLTETKEKLRQAKEEKTIKDNKAAQEADKKKRKRRTTTETPTRSVDNQPNKQNRDNNKFGNKNQNRPNNTNTNNNRNNNSRGTSYSPSSFNNRGGGKRLKSPIRKDKRKNLLERNLSHEEHNILEVTEYLSANELANLMDVTVNEVIAKCLQLGMFVSINQRINADVIQLIAEEFGYEVRFISLEESEDKESNEDEDECVEERPPIVTVMGHVDHGKTSLLDYIRKSNVIAGEAGGITQHIGAYEVELENNRKITFLDTPGHEAFTAMRARGAQITDIAIIVIAADDQIMPQTREAINHAQAAGVPMIFAINKIDKDGADPEKIKEQLAGMNLLVEDWGGKFQSQEISAKAGINVNLLLKKVLLEADILALKANPNRLAKGAVIESQLDKGKGIVTTVLIQTGTLRIGDVIVAGSFFGKVKALMNERGMRIKSAGPSTPVQILGLNGTPSAGDKLQVYETEREGREVATRKQQLLREQNIRQQKHITLEEIARRKAIGNFRELNIIVKGDVDGSVEALSDSLLKLTTGEVAVNIVHKGVGQISESDIMLATASDAIIIGFNVRPSQGARKLAEAEQIDIRIHSIIYAAIDEIKDALEGMLAPTIEEEILGVAEVREVFKISKVGTIAGCMVTEGKIIRQNQIRIIRDGVVIYNSRLASLKRFKDDTREVLAGFDCGLSIENFNDIKVGDAIESYATKEVKRKLA